MKRLLGIAALLCLSAAQAFATDYLYQMTSTLDPYISGGYIVTNCDSCVVTSANIVGWSLDQSAGVSPASLLTSSSLPGSSVSFQGPSGLTATPSALYFNFTYNPKSGDNVTFSSPNYQFEELSNYNAGSNYSPPFGAVMACGTLSCAEQLKTGDLEIGSFSKLAAPEISAAGIASALTLLLSGLAIVGARGSRIYS